jgi:hypothetical protein
MFNRLLLASLSVTAVLGVNRRPVPEFEINLDTEPEDRFTEVLTHFAPQLQNFVKFLHADSSTVKAIATALSLRRGKETDELNRELNGYAKVTGIPKSELHAIQLIYDLQTLMVPIVNFTHGSADMDLIQELLGEVLPSDLKVPEPFHVGCTGIIATSDEDGTVYHARNLDFSFAEYLQPMAYTGIFTKGGSEVFRAQTIAGFDAILTGMRKGPNGYTIEINTRYGDHWGANKEMIQNLFTNKIAPSGWTKRKILEEQDNYEDAVEAFSTTPYASTEYNIISGVKKGTILGRNPDGVAYQLPLSESGKKYIIMTNFDYNWGDIREIFDPTGGDGIFHPRRKPAEDLFDNADSITSDLLFDVINDHAVMAKDTIFQVIMDVETGLWNASLPECAKCGTPEDSIWRPTKEALV